MTDLPAPSDPFMQEAIDLARHSIRSGKGGPFGSVIVKDGQVIARGHNQVTSTNDPTAHAEVVAIREACGVLNSWQLDGCDLYTSCEPCPMCLGAIYWARPARVFFACTKGDAAAVGFDDHFIYDELDLPAEKRKFPLIPLMRDESLTVFQEWSEKGDRIDY
jgi:guanine deaminase